ncbi:glycosyltransferase [Thermococcus sibiricus]|uniref:Glycosyltransferase n=1 Tax=Thermococcus sibiricus TaxID=172049 RepID=A0A101ELT6_9EURY|nr:glycosyltransferase [Thermococcus sibiricus]KUK17744.1 MAG: Glycosyltransferase [Thermococcus sibiricus]
MNKAKSMKYPSITILSTVKNVRETIDKWMTSLLRQDYPGEYTIVVIDSNSTDGTKERLQEYAKKYPGKIQLIEYESIQPQALNYAIQNGLVKTELVALIDGDCEAPPTWLRTLVDTIMKTGADIVGGPGLTPNGVNFLQKLIGLDLDMRFLRTKRGFVTRHPNMNMLIKKEVLKRVPFDESLKVGYDADFGHRVTQAGYKMFFEPKAYVYHYHRSTLKGYIKQQINYARFLVKFYFKKPHAAKGDNINPPVMLYQPLLFGLSILSAILWFISNNSIFGIVSVGFILAVLILQTIDVIYVIKIKKTPLALLLYPLYMFRLILWVIGGILGILDLVTRRR